ncbi:MAG: hypothetical protein ACREJ3_09755 [Polyangiaceae bacterium]
MLEPKGEEDDTELVCPECGAPVKTTAKQAESGVIRCPRGHEFAVMGALDGVTGGRS